MGCLNKKTIGMEHYLSELEKAHQFFDNFYEDILTINEKSKLIKNDIFILQKDTRKEEERLIQIENEYKNYINFVVKIKS